MARRRSSERQSAPEPPPSDSLLSWRDFFNPDEPLTPAQQAEAEETVKHNPSISLAEAEWAHRAVTARRRQQKWKEQTR